MSGGGGGGGGYDGAGGGPDQPDCASLRFSTTLASPHLEVIASLEVDDALVVRLEAEADVSIIAVRTATGALTGTIVSNQARQLRECLQRGQSYEAVIVSIEGAAVEVEIGAAA